jgi:acetoin utilization deacetylase AcuC-like enzyme
MQIFHSPDHDLHHPQWYLADGSVRPCPEVPSRARALVDALQTLPGAQLIHPDSVDPLPALRAIHTPDYLHYLETIHALWAPEFATTGGIDVLPDTFPPRRFSGRRPAKPAAQAGYYCFDLAAPITQGTWTAALSSARCAVAAADALLARQPAAYALCRPPGHHAGSDYCGGFCYLNNAAAAAQHLLLHGHKRVALLDIDYHHGNGTQDIFYARDDLLFVSLHADPNTQYPYFWGYPEERGTGPGEGFTHNFPLPRDAPELRWLDTLKLALDGISHFAPEALVVSVGADIAEGDTVGDFHITLGGFHQIGRQLAQLRLPTAFIQEGGYHLQTLAAAIKALLHGFEAATLSTTG